FSNEAANPVFNDPLLPHVLVRLHVIDTEVVSQRPEKRINKLMCAPEVFIERFLNQRQVTIIRQRRHQRRIAIRHMPSLVGLNTEKDGPCGMVTMRCCSIGNGNKQWVSKSSFTNYLKAD